MPTSTAAPPQIQYDKDEKVFCFHGEFLYEAKVLEVRRIDSKDKNSPREYHVHYKGWKNSWDDWVPQDRLRKFTEDNKELAANLRRELVTAPPRSSAKGATSKSRKGQGSDLGSGRGSEERHSSVPAGGRGTKRGKDNDIEKVGPRISPDSDCYTNPKFDLPAKENPKTWNPKSEEPQKQDKGCLSHSLHGLLRQTSRLHSLHEIQAGQALSPDQESSFLQQGRHRRGRRHSTVYSATERGSRAFLISDSDEQSAKMTARSAGLAAQRKLTKRVSRGARSEKRSAPHHLNGADGSESDSSPSHAFPGRISGDTIGFTAVSRCYTGRGAKSGKLNDEVTRAGLSGLEIVRDYSPPPDEPEYISKETANNPHDKRFAPLIGGTTWDEKHKIDGELGLRSDVILTQHPKYDKTLREDRLNENKILFYHDQNPFQRLAIAGVPQDPIHLDPPGSGTPFDALKYPDRLVEVLNRMDADTVIGWDAKCLQKMPQRIFSKLNDDVLSSLPEGSLNRLPASVRDRYGTHAFGGPAPRSSKLDENFTTIAMLKLRERKQQREVAEPDSNLNESFPRASPFSCHECNSVGIKCNRDLPTCYACVKFGETCTYNVAVGFNQDIHSGSVKTSQYLGLDLTCSITEKHLRISKINHLNLSKPKEHLGKYDSKPTFTALPEIPKIPIQHRQVKRVSLTTVWQSLQELNPEFPSCFPGPPFPLLSQFYPGAPYETFTYLHSHSQEESFHLRPSIRITIPDHLKTLLVDDWENVTKSLLLVPLPSKAPANFIIDSYYDEEKASRRLGSADLDVLEEFCAGMKVYFEKSVGKILLYRFERGQLTEIRHLWESGKYPEWEGKGPGDAYGAEHLCRMLVNLPELIAQTNMDNQSVNRLREEISKFCTWLARNSGRFFCAKYEKPSADYVENAR